MLRLFLGDWLYWPVVVLVVSFASGVMFSNISLCYSELIAQIKEARRLTGRRKEGSDGQHAG